MLDLLSPVGDFDCLKAAVQNGADPAPVRDPVAAADAPGVRGECGVPMVSGLRAVGQAPAFCDGKLCVLPAVPGRTGSRNL